MSFESEVSTAIESRFQLRDEVLAKQLEDLSAKAARKKGKDDERIGVRLRLICEMDMFDRAQMAWAAIRKIHQETIGVRSPNLEQELINLLHTHMKAASLTLAGYLRKYADQFAAQFRGERRVDARYVYRLRRDATERQGRAIEEYVATLRSGVRSLLSSRKA